MARRLGYVRKKGGGPQPPQPPPPLHPPPETRGWQPTEPETGEGQRGLRAKAKAGLALAAFGLAASVPSRMAAQAQRGALKASKALALAAELKRRAKAKHCLKATEPSSGAFKRPQRREPDTPEPPVQAAVGRWPRLKTRLLALNQSESAAGAPRPQTPACPSHLWSYGAV